MNHLKLPLTPGPHMVPFDGTFRIPNVSTCPPEGAPDEKACRKRMKKMVKELDDLQQVLYAHDRYSLLLVFQAMDAAGKDSTIRALLRYINPAGCQVNSFKRPGPIALEHDFLWRTTAGLPQRGRIGVFNRSYYEEVLVVRVHPEILAAQDLPGEHGGPEFWKKRFRSIRDHEKHLFDSGTIILKFWLNVSRDEQKARFLSRLNEPEKHWKFSSADVAERQHWDEYMQAYEEALNETSREWAPWYAIPADNKPYMRMAVSEIVLNTLRGLDLDWPAVEPDEAVMFDDMRRRLNADSG